MPAPPPKLPKAAAAAKDGPKDVAKQAFVFSKDSELMRKPSFSESLSHSLQRKDPVEPGVKRGVGMLLKKTTTGQWKKRYYLLHSHYLSYFREDPSTDLSPQPAGSLDLWHVESVSLDDSTLVLRLSRDAAEARREGMGSQLLRDGKRMVHSLQAPGSSLARTVIKQLEVARRGSESPDLFLRASSAQEAQAWLRAMHDSPLLGSMVSAELPEDSQHRAVKEFRVMIPPSKELAFTGAFGDASLLVRGLPLRGASVSVQVSAGKAAFGGRASFEPALEEASGSVAIPLVQSQDVVHVEWTRQYPRKSHFVMMAAGAGAFAAVMGLVVSRSLKLALGLGLAAMVGVMAFLTVSSRQNNDVVVTRVYVQVASGSPAAPVKKSSRAAGQARTAKSADLNVTPEEAGALIELRERCKDLYQVPDTTDAFCKKHAKFLEAWGADLANLKSLEKRKRVLELHLMGPDFRAVRFLRARKHNMDKAEVMARECLTWRIALGSDDILREFSIPKWLLDYAGSPVFSTLTRPVEDSEARFERFWARDTDGHLSVFFRVGHTSTRRIFRKVHSSPEYLIRCVIWATELLRHDLDRMHVQTKGAVDSTVTAIVDLEGFAISNQLPINDLVGLARQFFPIFSTSYPELLNRVLVFRAPWLFSTVWTAVSPFIPEEVKEKIQIHSGEVKVARDVKPYLDLKYFPAYLGGQLTDASGPMCIERFGSYGPTMPDKGESLLAGLEPLAEPSSWKR